MTLTNQKQPHHKRLQPKQCVDGPRKYSAGLPGFPFQRGWSVSSGREAPNADFPVTYSPSALAFPNSAQRVLEEASHMPRWSNRHHQDRDPQRGRPVGAGHEAPHAGFPVSFSPSGLYKDEPCRSPPRSTFECHTLSLGTATLDWLYLLPESKLSPFSLRILRHQNALLGSRLLDQRRLGIQDHCWLSIKRSTLTEGYLDWGSWADPACCTTK